MASTRKSRNVNKRFLYPNETSPLKDRDSGSKSNKRKRKVSDMLGPQWSKEDIQRFYEAYRKYGKDWQKVAAAVRNRSVEMVEALYTMNRAYLSLPEGTASVVGLIAMMTDHYSVLEASDSEQESNDGNGLSRKPYKRTRGKPPSNTTKGSDRHFLDVSHPPSVASSFGCLSLLNKRNSGGTQPRAVGKRTPRIPVRYAYDKDNLERHISPSRQRVKPRLDTATDDDVNEVALALAEASHRGGSPQVSQTANKKSEAVAASPARLGERMCSESEMTSAKNIGIDMDDDGCEGSLGSTEGDNNFPRQKPLFVGRTVSTSLTQQKAKKSCGKKLEVEDIGDPDIDDIKEACSGTEGQKFSGVEGTHGGEVADVTFVRSSGQTSKKRSKKVLFGQEIGTYGSRGHIPMSLGVGDNGTPLIELNYKDEDDALDALQALADLSLMMPSTTEDTESIMPMKKGKESGLDKSGAREIVPRSQQKDKTKSSPFKKGGDQSVTNTQVSDSRASKPGKASGLDLSTVVAAKDVGVRRRKPKSSVAKLSMSEAQIDYDAQKKEFPDQGKKHVPLARVSEHSSSTDIRKEGNDSVVSSPMPSTTNKVKSPTKSRSRRKLDKSLIHRNYRDMKLSETSINDQSNMSGQLYHDKKTIGLKERLSNCLSNYRVRRWCVYEWFYSAIDYPWFAKSEFVEYLYHVGLGHVPRLTRVEWDVIRSSLGKPRRFSEQFLKEEKAKLNYYRQSVRNHYSELRLGKGEGLPTDLARPLTVGQRVIAIHPRSREVHNGSVLTVDHNRCRIQFDKPELGVEFVKDIDCMPLNPMENVPTSLNITVDKFEALKQFKVSDRYEDATKELIKFPPSTKVETAEGLTDVAAPHVMNNMLEQAKEGFSSPSLHVKVGQFEASSPQQALISQQSMLSQMLSKDADIRALAELTRVLDKKNAVVTELRCMNDDISEDSSLKDVDSFKKQYAAVLVQLNEVLDQVSSALMRLRQRNTYQGNFKLPLPVQMARSDDRGNLSNNLSRLPIVSQETGSHVYEIVETSRVRAQKMVKSVLQALSSLNGGSSIQKIEDAIDYINNHLSVDAMLPLKSSQVNGSLGCQNQQPSCTSNLVASDRALASKTIGTTLKREPQIPSELITNCVATLLMIQKCTERQFPPADVAQILDFAVTSLQPCSSHNLPVYAEIQKCMGIIRSQILALVPT